MLLNLREARVVIADWRQHCNRERPHSRLGYLSPEDFIQTNILTPYLGQLLGPAQGYSRLLPKARRLAERLTH